MNKQTIIPVLLILVFASFSVSAMHYYKDTTVAGTIYDADALVIVPGASVEVTCNGHVRNYISDSEGAYAVDFSYSECTNGDFVSVIATKDDLSGAASGVVHDFGLNRNLAIVNVPMTPEFGFYMGALSLLGAVGIFFVVRKD